MLDSDFPVSGYMGEIKCCEKWHAGELTDEVMGQRGTSGL